MVQAIFAQTLSLTRKPPLQLPTVRHRRGLRSVRVALLFVSEDPSMAVEKPAWFDRSVAGMLHIVQEEMGR